MISQTGFNGVLAAIAAAGAVGGFILLISPKRKHLAVALSLIVLVLGLGIVASLEAELRE